MRHQHDAAGRRAELRVVQRAPHAPSPREGGGADRNGHYRRAQDTYEDYHPPYTPGLPIHTALRHPSRSPGCPHLLRMLFILVCTCTCLLVVVIGAMTMAVVLPFGGDVGNGRLLGELRTDAVRRAVSSLGDRAGHRSPSPRPSPRPSPPPPQIPPPLLSPLLSPSPPPEARGFETWRREPAHPRTSEELLATLDGLAATAGGGGGDLLSAELDWNLAMESLPEWRQGGAYEELDERAVLGDLLRLVHHLHEVVRAQQDELRNLTRTMTLRRQARGGGTRAEGRTPPAAVPNRTANVSVRVLK